MWGIFLRFSTYKIVSSANDDNVTPSFPIWMSFIPFSGLIALARTSSTMLRMRGKGGQTRPLSRKSFKFFIVEYDVRYELCVVRVLK